METTLRDAALAHAPFFVTGPGESDILFTIVVWSVVLAVFGIGALYLSLHALPERMAHHANHTQIQLISILTLLALFTHNNLFWLAALVIAVVEVPDFYTPINAIADSVKAMAKQRGATTESLAPDPVAGSTAVTPSEISAAGSPSTGTAPNSTTSDTSEQENHKDV